MKYVGKRKVFISALALMLALVCTGAAFADSYPSPVFFLPSVNSRPEATTAPEETVLPEESAAPEETASPEATAAPEETASPEATDAPAETADPEATAAPEETVDPEATAAPEETASPEVTATPEATIDPNAATTLEPSPEATEDPTPTTTPEPTVEPTPAPTISYWRDEAGNLILDVNGMPVPIVPEGMQAPSEYLRNEHGAFVLDENGNPIPVNTIPEGAKKLSEIVDEQFPDRSIDIYAMFDGDYLNIGDSVTLIAVLNGYEGLVYHYQWQVASTDDWSDVSDAQDSAYTFTLTEENASNQWRIVVTITDVLSN